MPDIHRQLTALRERIYMRVHNPNRADVSVVYEALAVLVECEIARNPIVVDTPHDHVELADGSRAHILKPERQPDYLHERHPDHPPIGAGDTPEPPTRKPLPPRKLFTTGNDCPVCGGSGRTRLSFCGACRGSGQELRTVPRN